MLRKIVLQLAGILFFNRYMTQKLYSLVNDKCAVESPDNPMNQELLLGGHLYLMVIKVGLFEFRWVLRILAQ